MTDNLPSRASAYLAAMLGDGDAKLRHAFWEAPARIAAHGAPLLVGNCNASALLIDSGLALRSCTWANGRRAILDVLIPGDFAGFDRLTSARPTEQIHAAGKISYHSLGIAALRKLVSTESSVAMRVIASLAEAQAAATVSPR